MTPSARDVSFTFPGLWSRPNDSCVGMACLWGTAPRTLCGRCEGAIWPYSSPSAPQGTWWGDRLWLKAYGTVPWLPQCMQQRGILRPKCVGWMQRPRSGNCFVLSFPDICTASGPHQLLRHHILPSCLLKPAMKPEALWSISPTFYLPH